MDDSHAGHAAVCGEPWPISRDWWRPPLRVRHGHGPSAGTWRWRATRAARPYQEKPSSSRPVPLFAHLWPTAVRSWHAELGAAALTPVATGGSLAVVALSDNAVIALDLATGAVLARRAISRPPRSPWVTRASTTTTNGKLCGLLPRGGRGLVLSAQRHRDRRAARGRAVPLRRAPRQHRPVLNRTTGSLTRRDDLPSGWTARVRQPRRDRRAAGDRRVRDSTACHGKDPVACRHRLPPPATDVAQLFLTLPETVESFAVASDGTKAATLTIAPGPAHADGLSANR